MPMTNPPKPQKLPEKPKFVIVMDDVSISLNPFLDMLRNVWSKVIQPKGKQMKLITNVPHIDKLIVELIKLSKEAKVPGLFINIVTEAYCSSEEGTEGFVTVSTSYEYNGLTDDGSNILHSNFFNRTVGIYEFLKDGKKFGIQLEGDINREHTGDVDHLEDHAKLIMDYLLTQGYYDPKQV